MMLRRFKTAIASGVAGLALATSAVATCPTLAEGQFRDEDLLARVDYIAGKKVLILDGGVDDLAAARVDAALRAHRSVDEVWFNSPGGNAHQRTTIRQALRRWGVSARIPSEFWCISACNFAFVGAPIRQNDPGAPVRASYVHRRPLQVVRSLARVFQKERGTGCARRTPVSRTLAAPAERGDVPPRGGRPPLPHARGNEAVQRRELQIARS